MPNWSNASPQASLRNPEITTRPTGHSPWAFFMSLLRLLLLSVAFVWLATGLLVLHPYYRQEGAHSLELLGLPSWLMYFTCAGEVLLGLRVALGKPAAWITVLQIGMIVFFTAALLVTQPMLAVHPVGALTKNIPIITAIAAAWLVGREGWSRRAVWLLRAGVAIIWITEGLFPKILFQQDYELDIVARSPLTPMDAPMFLRLLGAAQVLAGLATLLLRGKALQILLAGEILGLILLPILVGIEDTTLLFHPFAPLIKNVPILAASVIVLLKEKT